MGGGYVGEIRIGGGWVKLEWMRFLGEVRV